MLNINRNSMVNMQADKIEDKKKTSGKIKSKTIDARDLNLGQSDALKEKRNRARKQAMKLINDAWRRDEKAAKGISDMQDQQSAISDKIHDLKLKVRDIDDKKEALREEYGIEVDSQEQKDLLLLEKYQNNMTGVSFDHFSEEEINRLKELQHTPLTEYQKKALELNGSKGSISKEIRQNENSLVAMTSSIRDAKIDQLKSQNMSDAQEGANEILEAASEDILNMLMSDAKEHIDEEVKEEQERAQEAKEEKEEQEEKLEKVREKRKEQEKILKGEIEAGKLETELQSTDQTVDRMDEVQKNIQKILNDNSLINEDLKGIEIDLNF